ncbi:carbonic anhydrase 14-like [Liolophura sinensis]|uniref:carbonic anhydrase 14-like n=1 Tax=Liolophura sinensis TaxID=3198878 RepID=UPI003158A1EA
MFALQLLSLTNFVALCMTTDHQPEGLAVLGALFEINDDDNEAFQPIINKLCAISYPHDTAVVDPLRVEDLLPEEANQWYRYPGSLTTPPCFESVIWTVFKNFVKISENQPVRKAKVDHLGSGLITA